jgi:D-alanine-D-alanine ligase
MTDGVIILHNAVGPDAVDSNKSCWKESNVGVLEEVRAVETALDNLGIANEIIGLFSLQQLPDILNKSRKNIIFNLVEELPQCIFHSAYVPAICSAFGKTCTGNSSQAMLITQDKWRSKLLLKAAKLPCPEGIYVALNEEVRQGELKPGRYIVKPMFSDASEGIDADSVVEVPGGCLNKVVERIHNQFRQPALIEEFIPHRELNVSVLEHDDKPQVLPLAEIDFSAFAENQTKIVDYSAKWLTGSIAYNNTPRIIPARLSESTADLVRQYAIRAWQTIGCIDYIRVDFRLDEKEQPYIIEVNTNPDISPDAGFTAALTAAEITYESFVKILLKNAKKRQQQQKLFLGSQYETSYIS